MKKLVTSALPYPNGPLHIGHVAGVHLPADIYARFLRLMGEEVITLCGTDDHGVGIQIAAKKEGITEVELVEKYRAMILQSLSKIGVEYDIFSHTHSNLHQESASDFFVKLQSKGFIERRPETMAYCNACDNYLPDRYIEGTCPKCQNPGARGDQCEKCGNMLSPTDLIDPCCKMCDSHDISQKETYHYFFKLSMFQKQLEEWVDSHKSDWKPNVFASAKKWIKEGLQDRAISRDIRWGIPIPGDTQKKMYVWFEAPIGYISFLEQFAQDIGDKHIVNDIWGKGQSGEVFHFIGKDNVVFHTIIWPALLMAHGDYNLPTNVPGNDFVNLEGSKLSTSRNHAVWLHELVETFNTESIRYYLTYCIPENKDSNFTWDEFKERNNELGNTLGNLVNRINVFVKKNFNGEIAAPAFSDPSSQELLRFTYSQTDKVIKHLGNFSFRDGLRELFMIFHALNKYLHDNAPWTIVKTSKEDAHELINCSAVCLIKAMIPLQPYLPETARLIVESFGISPDESFLLKNIQEIPPTYPLKVKDLPILFNRIDDSVKNHS